ncbi:MAG: zinc ribbon domain-containing protein [Bacillaceae bacterium]
MSELQTKLGGGLNKIQDSLQKSKAKLQTAQEVNQYKRTINENVDKRTTVMIQLGEFVYKKFRAGELQDEQLKDIAKKVIEYDINIYKAEKIIAQLSAKEENHVCSGCGEEVLPEDKFCGSCGHLIENSQQKEVYGLVVCRICEQEVQKDTTYCQCCGNQLGE